MSSYAMDELFYLAADRLADLRERVVFVGGAVRRLLVTDPAVEGPRPTDDIDVIIELTANEDRYSLETALHKRGFRNDTREDAPICRFVHGALTIDVMPTDPSVLGFSNRWYPHAMRTAQEHFVDVAGRAPLAVRVVSSTCFIATKLDAYAGRGKGDLYHHDIEDIIAVVDGRATLLDELAAEPKELRAFVATKLEALFVEGLAEVIERHLPGDRANQARAPMVLARLRRMTVGT